MHVSAHCEPILACYVENNFGNEFSDLENCIFGFIEITTYNLQVSSPDEAFEVRVRARRTWKMDSNMSENHVSRFSFAFVL